MWLRSQESQMNDSTYKTVMDKIRDKNDHALLTHLEDKDDNGRIMALYRVARSACQIRAWSNPGRDAVRQIDDHTSKYIRFLFDAVEDEKLRPFLQLSGKNHVLNRTLGNRDEVEWALREATFTKVQSVMELYPLLPTSTAKWNRTDELLALEGGMPTHMYTRRLLLEQVAEGWATLSDENASWMFDFLLQTVIKPTFGEYSQLVCELVGGKENSKMLGFRSGGVLSRCPLSRIAKAIKGSYSAEDIQVLEGLSRFESVLACTLVRPAPTVSPPDH
jgi:hypothetical protein